MLVSLSIHNLAIIRQASLRFVPGLTAITGETGAGKSLVAQALAFVLGARGRTDAIRAGRRQMVVEAIFQGQPGSVAAQALDDLGVPYDEEEWAIRRSLSRDGRNQVVVNGVRITVEQLRLVGESLLQVHGQFEHQGLLQPAYQRRLLDTVSDATPLAEECARHHARCTALRARLEELRRAAAERDQRIAFLEFQRDEIAAANPQPGEDAELEHRHHRLAHLGELRTTTTGLIDRLRDQNPSLLGEVAAIRDRLHRLASLEPEVAALDELAEQGEIALQELVAGLDDFARTLADDPGALEETEARLATLHGLHRKYGGSQEAVLDRLRSIVAELDTLARVDAEQEGLLPTLAAAEGELGDAAERLTERRRAGAALLEREMPPLLAGLEMGGGCLAVALTPLASIGARGAEDVAFAFTANPGQPPRPLARIASGGELSRVGLALRRLYLGDDRATLLFDEVDAGVGGQTGERIGEMLAAIAGNHQTLCITHLPQVARHADGHLRITKHDIDGATEVEVRSLTDTERVDELARMLGGTKHGKAARRHAAALLE
ncbi:MAG: DNA repair protein RecN [Nitrospirota bacterium]|jgi:DNA repair protein RecN (Recombination protein N)